MSGTIKGIIVEIGGDTSGLQKALNKVNSATASLSKELKGINSLLKLDPSNTVLLSQKQQVLAENIETTRTKLQELKKAQELADETILNNGKISQENYRNLQREIIATEQKINQLMAENSKWNRAGDYLIDYGKKITDISGKIDTLGKNLTTKLTIPITAIATGMSSTTASFEDAMRQVAATMGITADEIKNGSKAYKILEEAAKKCGEMTKYSASEAAEALNYLALAGYDAEKSAETLPKVLNLAAAGNMDLATATDMVTDAMSALEMETKDLDKYIDEMAKTSQKSKTNVSQLGEATLTCAGTVKLANMSLETMNTELGILANNGVKGAEGGTHLRNIILSLTSPTDKAADALKELGINVLDSSGNMRDLNDIMKDFDKKLSNLSNGRKTKIISQIFNKTDISAVNALIKGSGEEFSKLKAKISNCNGAAQDMADTMNSSVKGQITLLKSQIEAISIKFSEKLMPTIKDGIEHISRLADKINNLSDEETENVIKTAAFVAAIGPALMIVGKLGTTTGNTIITIGNLSKAIANVKNGVTQAEGQVGTFTTVIGALTSPVGLTTAAIVALTAATVIYAKKQAEEIYGSNELSEAIDKQQTSWENLQKAREEQLTASANEIGHLQNLKDELGRITDENGKVKEAYKDRASVILNELNKALGTEYSLNGDIIESYKDVQAEIQNLIDKKKAEALLNAYSSEYAEAIKNEADATQNLIKLKQQLSEEYAKLSGLSGKERAEAQLRITNITQQIQQESEQISQYGYTIQNYETLQTACVNGSAEAIAQATEQMGVSWNTAKEQLKMSLTEQIAAQQQYVLDLKTSLNDAKLSHDETQAYIIQRQLTSAEERLANLRNELSTTANTIDTDTQVHTSVDNLGIRMCEKYEGEISKLSPFTRGELDSVTNTIDSDITVQNAAARMGQRTTTDYDYNNQMLEVTKREINNSAQAENTDFSVQKGAEGLAQRTNKSYENRNQLPEITRKEIKAAAHAENTDSSVGAGARRLANEANSNFNNNVNGHKWGSDLSNNIAGGILAALPGIASAAAQVAGTIAAHLHHSVPDKGPLADEMDYMPDMIDNLTKTLLASSPKLEKATLDVASKMAKNLDLSTLDFGKYQANLQSKIIDNTKTIFTTPQITFNVQKMDKANLDVCFNYINDKFGSKY